MKKTFILSIIILASLSLVLTGCGEEKGVIESSGASELTYTPDMVELSVGYAILKPTAQEAQSSASEVTNKIIQGLKSLNISESNIKTESLSLYEEKDWSNGQKSLGWRSNQIIKIKSYDLTQAGTIIDNSVSNGANQINYISFGFKPETEVKYKQDAIKEAIKNAQTKAESMAQGLNSKLGKIKSVSESNYYYSPRMYALESADLAKASGQASSVLPGEVAVTANVVVVYYIK